MPDLKMPGGEGVATVSDENVALYTAHGWELVSGDESKEAEDGDSRGVRRGSSSRSKSADV
jgi:hypothetical protein